MAGDGRSRNSPCFCGSGRKLKQCCAPRLRAARTYKPDGGGCRWRFWAPHDEQGRFAGEVAEHVCDGERFWIARGTEHGTSWQIDSEPATLFEILERLPGSHYEWAIGQTMAALGDAARALAHDVPTMPAADFAEIRELTVEVLRLAHASDAIAAHLPAPLGSAHSAPTPGVRLAS